MDRASLVSKLLRAAVAILYGFIFIVAATLLYRYGGLSKDAGWTWRMTPAGAIVDAVNPYGPAAIVTPGARIIAVNGDRRAASAGPRPWLNSVRPGESYRVAWSAPGWSQTRETTLVMGSRRSPGDLMMGLCDLFLSLCYFAAGLFIWRARPSGVVARPCCLAALLIAFYMEASAIGPVSPLLSGFYAVIYVINRLIFPFYLTVGCAFFAVFPAGDKPRGYWRAALAALWAAAAIVWAIVLPFRVLPFLGLEWRLKLLSGLDLNTRPELGLVTLRHGYVVLCGVFLFAVIAHNYRRLENAAMRLRVRWVILGAALGIAPAIAASLALAVSPHTTRELLAYYSLSTLSIAAIPATIAYAVVCHRLMGIRIALLTGFKLFAARRVLRFATLAPAVVAGVYLSRHLVDLWLQHPVAAVLIAAALLIALLRKELLDFADRVLLRAPYDRDRVTGGLLETLLRQESPADIARAAAARIEPALQPERLLVYCGGADAPQMALVYGAADETAPRTLALNSALLEKGPVFLKPRLTGLGDLVLAAPVAAGEGAQPVGVLLLGRKRSGEAYTATDLDVLDDIARQVYLALKLRELEHAQTFSESKTHFLAQVSHELRNPLHGVVGLTSLLLDTPLSEEQQEYTQLIRRSSEWMVSIANDLIDFTRSEAGKLKLDAIEFEWAPLLEDVITIAAQRASGKTLEVILEMDPSMPAASTGDPARVRQVLLNLLDNAVKFTDRGWIRLRSSGCAQSIRIEVSDTGPGIPDEMRPRLFEPYQQGAAGRREGAGLGLTISHRLVAAMGGSLTCDSRAGKGAAFEVILPALAESQPVTEQPLAGVRILCIDQLGVSAQALYFTLIGLGARVTARHGDMADQGAASGPFDVVLYSAAFDSRDTAWAIRNIRRAEGATPVIVLHHGAPPFSAREARILGPIEQVRKPAIRKTLLRAIRAALAIAPSETGMAACQPLEGACAGARVLLVEDDPATARISEMMLARLGCVVFVSPTGRQALRSLETVPFDIVLIDAKLPDIDGAGLTRRIRALGTERSTTPIIALSGDGSSESRACFFDAGADDYLVKPASIEELRDVIRLRAHHAGTA